MNSATCQSPPATRIQTSCDCAWARSVVGWSPTSSLRPRRISHHYASPRHPRRRHHPSLLPTVPLLLHHRCSHVLGRRSISTSRTRWSCIAISVDRVLTLASLPQFATPTWAARRFRAWTAPCTLTSWCPRRATTRHSSRPSMGSADGLLPSAWRQTPLSICACSPSRHAAAPRIAPSATLRGHRLRLVRATREAAAASARPAPSRAAARGRRATSNGRRTRAQQ